MEDTMEAAMVTAMVGEAMVEATAMAGEAMVMAVGDMVDIMEDTEINVTQSVSSFPKILILDLQHH